MKRQGLPTLPHSGSAWTLRAAALLAMAPLLAACQSIAPAPSDATASQEAHTLARTIGENIGRCWFGPGETAFAGYIYSPEPNAVQPRILIVPKSQPAERPLLVVETRGARSASTYGPLLDSPQAARIRADIDRWAGGSTSCT